MDVREKLVEQAISYFWYGVSHDIFSEPVTTYAKLAIEALKKENGVTAQACKLGVKKTNADRIRNMTDEELNDLFNEIYNAGVEDAVSYEWGRRTNSFEWTMEWLQMPAEVSK